MTLHDTRAHAGYTTSELIEQTFAAINGAWQAQSKLPSAGANFTSTSRISLRTTTGNTGSEEKDGFGRPPPTAPR